MTIGMRYGAVLLYMLLGLAGLFSACVSHSSARDIPVRHMSEAGWEGSASVYVDRMPNKVILKEDGGDTGRTVFYCLRVGLYDSTAGNDKQLEAAKEKYYQLDMYKDWVLLNDKDTILPIYDQPIPHKKDKLTELVLVYEIPRGFVPGRLFYKDPYRLLGNRQTLVLQANNN